MKKNKKRAGRKLKCNEYQLDREEMLNLAVGIQNSISGLEFKRMLLSHKARNLACILVG
jgi:hypothetical protein